MEVTHIRRPLPWPRLQGQRLGPPQVWNWFLSVQACRLPPEPSVVRAFKPAVCQASTRKMPCGSFDQALWPQAFVVREFKRAICLQSHLFLGHSSLPFASRQTRKMLRGSFDQALWPQAFVRALKLKPAVCLQSHLFLGCSSLPFASRHTHKMLRGSFDQALWPQAFVRRACRLPSESSVFRAFKPTAFQPSNP